MNPYDPPTETPPKPAEPVKYKPRFGPTRISVGFGIFAFAMATVVSWKLGNLGDWFVFNCLIGVGAMLLACGLEYGAPTRKG